MPSWFRLLCRLCGVLLCLHCTGLRVCGAERPVFRAGVHVADITPTNYPVRVNAMFTERSATNAVDPLVVRALALDDGNQRLVIAVVDTCMMTRDLIDRAKALASRFTGVRVDRMLVSATHTHSAPAAMGCLGSRMDPAYAEFLAPRIAQAIEGAVARLEPARVGWGVVDDWDHTFNRRWIRRPDRLLTDPFGDTSVRAHMHPGHESPDAVGPSGPVDPGLSVVGVTTAEGRPLALVANYSQHYYGSPLLSSDYFGRFAGYVGSLLGVSADTAAPFVGMMSQGTSGDLMWMDYSALARDVGYDAYARALAERAVGVWKTMTFQEWVPLAMAERTVEFSFRVPDASRLAWARKVAATVEGRLPATLPEVYALEALYLHERPRTELKLQAVRIGEVGITAIPNEVFALTGLKLKDQSPLQPTFNVELANGAEGYIPPVEQHHLGGYTTWPARTAGLEVGAEARIVETLLSLLEEVAQRPRRPETLGAGPYVAAVLASRPLAYWRMEDRTGPDVRDHSGRRSSAQFEPGVALFLPGVSRTVGFHPARPEVPNGFSGGLINRSVHLAGGRVKASLPPLGATYSVECWVWNGLLPTAREVTGYLMARVDAEGPAGDSMGLGGAGGPGPAGRLFVGPARGEAGSVLTGSHALGFRAWHHIVFVRSGSRITVYLDGRAEPEIQGDLAEPLRSGPTTLWLGGGAGREFAWEGRLDEVAVYGRALTADEVVAHFRASGIQEPPAGLTAP